MTEHISCRDNTVQEFKNENSLIIILVMSHSDRKSVGSSLVVVVTFLTEINNDDATRCAVTSETAVEKQIIKQRSHLKS